MKKKPNLQDATLKNIRALKKQVATLEERLGFVEAKAGLTAEKVYTLEIETANLTLHFNNLEESLAEKAARVESEQGNMLSRPSDRMNPPSDAAD